jgi:tetratricopeptide (TPR) repeat protein
MRTFLRLLSPILASLVAASGACASDSACMALNSLAVKLCEQGQWNDATKTAKEALERAEGEGGAYCLQALKSLQLLGKLNGAQGKLVEAQRFRIKAHAASIALYGTVDPNVVCSLVELGKLSVSEANYDRAESYYRDAIQVASKAGTVADRAVAPALIGLGELYKNNGKDREAEALYRKALYTYQMSRKYKPSLDVPIAEILCSLGDIARDRGDFAAASQNYRTGLEKFTLAGRPYAVCAADTRVRLGDMYLRWAKPVRAERQYRKALAVYQRIGGNELKSGVTMQRIGDVFNSRGCHSLAGRYYMNAVVTLRKCAPRCDATLATVMKALADLQVRSGDHARAVPVSQAALATVEMNSEIRQ